jgi:hypothetical protein
LLTAVALGADGTIWVGTMPRQPVPGEKISLRGDEHATVRYFSNLAAANQLCGWQMSAGTGSCDTLSDTQY